TDTTGMQATRKELPIHKEIKEALLKNDQALAVAKINEYFDQQKNVPLNIAITGESGSGKSTFVNAFRGIDNRDEKAAPTGTTETTMEVNPYPHPNHPNVTFWDLPGIGTTKFPADKYMKHVGFEKFDFFIIVSSDRFKENDVRLAKEIQRMEKKFYFVRSKIDNSMRDEERTQRDFNKERSLKKIKDNCIQCLQEQGLKSPQVFLVSSFDLQLYDFHLLEETLERELPEHKRDAFLFENRCCKTKTSSTVCNA
uniref:IRG-type G domain-containing protein n=1 Tax=Labrus bergylta TaxID=56723 RepID=A0A3Q3GNL4_9LABR